MQVFGIIMQVYLSSDSYYCWGSHINTKRLLTGYTDVTLNLLLQKSTKLFTKKIHIYRNTDIVDEVFSVDRSCTTFIKQ